MLHRNLSNDKGLEVNVTISQKKKNWVAKFDKKNERKRNEQKSWELTVCKAKNKSEKAFCL